MAAATATKVITPKATLSYPHLDKPQAANQDGTGKQKYSAALVFRAGSDLSQINAAIDAVAEAKWPGKSKIMFAQGALKHPIRRDVDQKGYPEGSVFMNVRSDLPPGIVYSHAGPDGKPATVPQDKIRSDLYAGCEVRASVAAFAYDTNGNKGVSFALNNVQKIGEGERLDSRIAAENEFVADLSQAPADLSSLV